MDAGNQELISKIGKLINLNVEEIMNANTKYIKAEMTDNTIMLKSHTDSKLAVINDTMNRQIESVHIKI